MRFLDIFITILLIFIAPTLHLIAQEKHIFYEYDELNRLKSVNYNYNAITDYTYDELGNRKTEVTKRYDLKLNLTDKSACQGESVDLGTFDDFGNLVTFTGGSGNYLITWSPKYGLKNANTANPTVLNAKYTRTYTLRVQDYFTNEVATEQMKLTVNRAPFISLPRIIRIKKNNSVNLGDRLKVSGGTPDYTYEWTDKNGWTSNEDNPVVTPQTSTRYYLKVIDASSCESIEKSTYVRVSRRKVAELYEFVGGELDLYYISIYPNPTNDILNIEADFAEKVDFEIKITDMLGVEIQHLVIKDIETYEGQIDMDALPTGAYIIQVRVNNERIVKKIIKQ